MTDLRIGVIGYGMRGGLSRHAHQPGAGSAVTLIAEPTERGKADARKAYGGDISLVDNEDQLLQRADELDAVMVLTPDYNHAEIAIKTLSAGLATFVEKPMGITREQCDEMLATSYTHKTRLYVGHNMRHMPVVRQMKEIIDSGEIGAVKAVWTRHFVGHGGDYYFKDWHADRSKATSLLLQKGAHDLDVIHWLAQGYSRRVSGIGELMIYGDVTSRRDNSDRRMGDWFSYDHFPPAQQTDLNPVVDVEDISMLQMQLDNGVLASYEQCHFTPDYWRNYTVIGDAGRIENMGDGGGQQIHIWKSRRSGPGSPDRVEVIGRGDGGHGGADPNLVNEFLRFVREGGMTEVSTIAAREAVATGCAGADSIRAGGGVIAIPEVPAEIREHFDGGQA